MDKKNILEGVDIDSIIKKSLASSIRPELSQPLDESYVAEPKPFKQVSELVSQKTKDAHNELYKEHVQVLNDVSANLDTADRGSPNPHHSEFRSLKVDESLNLNAVWLHELYFANCFDPHSEIEMDTKSYMRLQRDFGTFDDWQKDFISCALSARDGWVVCGYNIFLRKYVNTVIDGDADNVMLGLYPIVVIDMHEHAYSRDYLTDKKSFLISQMREINWQVVEERFLKAEAINEVLK